MTEQEIIQAVDAFAENNPVGNPFAAIALRQAYEKGMRDALKRVGMYNQ